MNEPQRLSMQGLTWTNSETVLHELFIFSKSCSFQDIMSAIPLIVEKRMTDIFHMYTDLVRAPRLQTALHQAHVAQAFQHGVMGDGGLALIAFREDGHLHTVTRVTTDISLDTPLILLNDAPYQGTVFTFGCLVEELQA